MNRRRSICGTKQRRGEIFLEDDETVAFIVKNPFRLQPAPPRGTRKYKIGVRHLETLDESDSETDGEVGEFKYDSDAYEKV